MHSFIRWVVFTYVKVRYSRKQYPNNFHWRDKANHLTYIWWSAWLNLKWATRHYWHEIIKTRNATRTRLNRRTDCFSCGVNWLLPDTQHPWWCDRHKPQDEREWEEGATDDWNDDQLEEIADLITKDMTGQTTGVLTYHQATK